MDAKMKPPVTGKQRAVKISFGYHHRRDDLSRWKSKLSLFAIIFTPVVWLCWSLMASVGHFLLILAYARAPAATLMPFLYAQIGFAMLGGWLIFDHVPDQWATLGIILVAICGAAGAWLTVREGRITVQPAES